MQTQKEMSHSNFRIISGIFIMAVLFLFTGKPAQIHADSFQVNSSTVNLSVGGSASIDCQAFGGGISLNCNVSNSSIASVTWGNWSSDNHIKATIYGRSAGSCVLTFTGTQNGRSLGSTYKVIVYVGSQSNISSELKAELNGAKIAYKSRLTYTENILSYFLYDMNSDGIPELIYLTGYSEADFVYHVVTYSNGTHDCGTISGGHTVFYNTDVSGSGGLTQIVSTQGYASKYQYTIKSQSKTALGYEDYVIISTTMFREKAVGSSSDPYGFGNSYAEEIEMYSAINPDYVDTLMKSYGV